ncbi:hypothetical protein D1007_45497 [Hordeum vulgare]|nr:hypothetical protein D1007_45497 [Hordeum vulgare]
MALGENSRSFGVSNVEMTMQELGLKEEDLDDIVFDKREAPEDVVRWVEIDRVNTCNTYSQTWFFCNMRRAWDLAQEAKFRPLRYNLYIVQFSCLED